MIDSEIKCVAGRWWRSLFWDESIGNLILDYMLPEGLIHVGRAASAVGDMGSSTTGTFWILFFCWDSFCENELHHTQHISVFFVQFGALCLKPWHLKHCWIESVVLNSSTLKIMPVFWHTNPPEMSASACFVSSHLILITGRSLPDLSDSIHSASAWVILLQSSSSLKSSNLTLFSFCGVCIVIALTGRKEFGIFARRAMVDQAREGLCYQ